MCTLLVPNAAAALMMIRSVQTNAIQARRGTLILAMRALETRTAHPRILPIVLLKWSGGIPASNLIAHHRRRAALASPAC
ncbi:hypothetical protein PsYK624_090710 [Phanerochaete sordida]|uniref:Uncharacterized protein n=1 Tax=Phanerochaete sordida TaxID=48140 RepID=A0A9P3GBA9_9APHY|nr:hypothetical protein PsYK624_090710 [Phanerochaete sordida]